MELVGGWNFLLFGKSLQNLYLLKFDVLDEIWSPCFGDPDDDAHEDVPDEHQDLDEHEPEQPDPDHEGEADDRDVDSFEDLAKGLTVTAKKLAAMTQGRKFRNGPKKTIEQRKQESPCAACGELGHWAGDEQCKVSSSKGGKTKSTKGGNGKSDTGKKVFTVNHYTGFQAEEPWEDQQEYPHSVMVVFSTSDKIPLVSNMEHAGRFMILDTACQHSCRGTCTMRSCWNRLSPRKVSPFLLFFIDKENCFNLEPATPKYPINLHIFQLGLEIYRKTQGGCIESWLKEICDANLIAYQTSTFRTFFQFGEPIVPYLRGNHHLI